MSTIDIKKLRRNALLADAFCLALSFTLLYFGSRGELPVWVLVGGLAIALASLIVAVKLSFKARRAEKQIAHMLWEQHMQKMNEVSNQEEPKEDD